MRTQPTRTGGKVDYLHWEIISSSLIVSPVEKGFTTKGVGKGTGLGLSSSRQIVEEKHGGKITFISAEGKGTEFAIALPLT